MKAEQALPQMAADRKTTIEHILRDLLTLRGSPSVPNQYAVEENIAFFKAIRSFPRYIKWLIRRAPKLDRDQLLELTDFPFPRWDREMHLKLMEVEKQEFPGMVTPLINRLYELISAKKDEVFIGMNLGCGGMEVERQILRRLIDSKSTQKIILIGIDQSPSARELARENLRETEPFVEIREVNILNQDILQGAINEKSQKHIVLLARNDIFSLSHQISAGSLDAIYHTLFKHHLPRERWEELDVVMTALGRHVIEYDGFLNWLVVIGQTIVGWHHPSFLNAELFSNFRFLRKDALKHTAEMGKKSILFYPRIGTYLME